MALTFVIPCVATANARRFTLRGVPDTNVQGGEYNPVGGYGYKIANFVTETGNWYTFARNLNVVSIPLASVDALGNVVTNAPITLLPNDVVTIRQADRGGGAFGTGAFFVDTVTDTTHFKIRGWNFGATVKGTVRPASYAYRQLSPSAVVNPVVVVRKVGRPSAGYRGRASARA